MCVHEYIYFVFQPYPFLQLFLKGLCFVLGNTTNRCSLLIFLYKNLHFSLIILIVRKIHANKLKMIFSSTLTPDVWDGIMLFCYTYTCCREFNRKNAITCFNDLGLSWPGLKDPTIRMKSARSNGATSTFLRGYIKYCYRIKMTLFNYTSNYYL